jgi:hypothetical protein
MVRIRAAEENSADQRSVQTNLLDIDSLHILTCGTWGSKQQNSSDWLTQDQTRATYHLSVLRPYVSLISLHVLFLKPRHESQSSLQYLHQQSSLVSWIIEANTAPFPPTLEVQIPKHDPSDSKNLRIQWVDFVFKFLMVVCSYAANSTPQSTRADTSTLGSNIFD